MSQNAMHIYLGKYQFEDSDSLKRRPGSNDLVSYKVTQVKLSDGIDLGFQDVVRNILQIHK